MATLNELLARWLARRLRHSVAEDDIGPVERGALIAHVKDMRGLVRRLKESAEKRGERHDQLKRQLQDVKRQFQQLKEEAKAARRELKDLRVRLAVLAEQREALRALAGDSLARPGAAPVETTADDARWSRYLRRRWTVWRYPMRLGVLRQHEPRPLGEQRLPRWDPPGDPAAWPRVSVVTPSFQQAAFLGKTMASVLDQDYPRLEYRVLDGGSTDGSVALIQSEAPRLEGWESRPDNGPASAINRGFAQSSGEIMAWLNSDDLLLPGVVRFVAAWFARHPEVDVVYGHRLMIDGQGHQVGRWVMPPHDDEALLWMDYIPQETLFWRRRIWERAGGRLDESFQFAFDWDLLLRFQKAGARMTRLPWFLGCFRVHDAQKSSAGISSIGRTEIARLRRRELGTAFSEERLERKAVSFQARAIWYDRFLRAGLHVSAFRPRFRAPPPAPAPAPRPPVAPGSLNRHFCTCFDLCYAAAGIAMLRSLRRHGQPSKITVLCLDGALAPLLEAEFGGEIERLSLAELEEAQPDLRGIPPHDEPWERYAMLKPFLIEHLLLKLEPDATLAFVDADLFLFADPGPLFGELAGSSVAISPHRFNPATEHLRVYGRHNAGFSLWRPDAAARALVREWRDQCAAWCRNRAEPDGRFMDQGYLNSWPERHPGVVVLGHPGENLAPWNVGSHHLAFDGNRVRVDGCALIFFHFSGVCLAKDGRWGTFYAFDAMRQDVVLERIYRPYLRTLDAISTRLREHHGVDGRGSVREWNPAHSWLDLSSGDCRNAGPVMIWLPSFPRCGNKLARLILATQFDARTFTVYQQLGEPDVVPVTPHWTGGLPPVMPVPESGDPKDCLFMKTHELPATGHPAIYVIRDGRDAYVSYAHFVRQHFPDQVSGMSYEQVLGMLIQSRDHFAGWSRHVQAWTGRPEPTAVIRFEDMIADPAGAMTAACARLGVRLSQPVRRLPGFDELKAGEPSQFRKGKAGAWREEMPPHLEELFWSLHGETMTTFGYAR